MTIYEAINAVIHPISGHDKVIFLYVEKNMLKWLIDNSSTNFVHYNLMVRFLKYKLNNKLLGCVISLRVTQSVTCI